MLAERIFPEMKSSRLLLRKLTAVDAEDLFFLRSNDEVNKYLVREKAKSIEDAHVFMAKIEPGLVKGDLYYWGVCLEDKSGIVGTVCLFNLNKEEREAEIGYELMPAQQGKGIMVEAIEMLLRFAFEELKMERLFAVVEKENLRSVKLLEKFGFEVVGKEEEGKVLRYGRGFK